jgi:hypothetical protein
MMIIKRIGVTVFAFLMAFSLTLGLFPSMVSACSCIMPVPPLEALAQSDAVFVGTVTGITLVGDYRKNVEFEALVVWKGDVGKGVSVSTARDSAACGFGFEAGKTYVVYAHDDAEGEGMTVNSCSRTHEVSGEYAQDEDVIALGAGTAPVSGTGSETSADDEGNLLVTAIVATLAVAAGYAASRIRSKKA